MTKQAVSHMSSSPTFHFQQRVETTKREVNRKKRKVFVTAHAILRTAAMFLASALNRGSHPPEI